MSTEFIVSITETITHSVWITADSPLEAQQIAEENYKNSEVTDVSFEVDPLSRRYLWEREREGFSGE